MSADSLYEGDLEGKTKELLKEGLITAGNFSNLSKATGISPQTLYAWAAGKKKPYLTTFLKLKTWVEKVRIQPSEPS